MKVGNVLGITRSGNAVTRKMHQSQRALSANVILAGSMAANMVGCLISKDITSFTTSAGIGYFAYANILKWNKAFKSFVPEYQQIVKRAEKIYQRKIV